MNKIVRLLVTVFPAMSLVPSALMDYVLNSDYERYVSALGEARRINDEDERNREINKVIDNLRAHVEKLAQAGQALNENDAKLVLLFARNLQRNYRGTQLERLTNRQEEEYYLKLAADYGLPAAQFRLGKYYFDKMQYEEAFACFEAAAKQHEPRAAFQLGWCYLNGWGTEPDNERAGQCWEQAAHLGNAEAALRLAAAYESGVATPRAGEISMRKAIKWYLKAAQGAHSEVRLQAQWALRRLGVHL